MRVLLLVLSVLLVMLANAALAAGAAYEGVWARNERECRDEDGPNSRTTIDLREPKLGPIVDHYENHCRVRRSEPTASGVVLHLRCHEFWEEFEKRQRGSDSTTRIVVRSAQRITVDGEAYVRCVR